MKVLLVFPPDVSWMTEPPLGLAYLAASIRKKYDVGILDASVEKLTLKETYEYIKTFSPDVVGITVLTPIFKQVVNLSKILKDKSPNIIIVCGGPHATIMPEETLKKTGADIAVIGEGEITFPELIDLLEENRDLKQVKGIAFRKNGRIIKTARRLFIVNLDSIVFPARDLLHIEQYTGSQMTRMRPVTSVFTGRGCPFNCTFCSVKAVWGRSFRRRSPQNVLQECVEIYERYGIKEIFFNDDLFTMDKKWTLQMCEELIKTGIGFSWKCLSRVDTVDIKTLRMMKKAGCHTIAFGVESGNQQILNTIHKKCTLGEIENAFVLAKKVGLYTWAFFMIGNLGENQRTVQDTLDFSLKLNADSISFSIASPMPGSDLYSIVIRKGLLPKNPDWDKFNYYSDAIIGTEDLSPSELRNLQEQLYMTFYSSMNYLLQNVLLKIFNFKNMSLTQENLKNFNFYVTKTGKNKYHFLIRVLSFIMKLLKKLTKK